MNIWHDISPKRITPDDFYAVIEISKGDKNKYEAERIHLKQDAAKINANVKQLVFTQGGPEDIAYNNCKETLKLFDEAGIKYEFSEMPGGHSWHVWRHNLRDLAPRIFK